MSRVYAEHKTPLSVWIGTTCAPFAPLFSRALRCVETMHFPVELVVALTEIPTACRRAELNTDD